MPRDRALLRIWKFAVFWQKTLWAAPYEQAIGDQWFGVTYAEDKDSVSASFKQLLSDGVYQSPLW